MCILFGPDIISPLMENKSTNVTLESEAFLNVIVFYFIAEI